MAGFAPTRAVAQAGVVIHLLANPTRRAGVASIAVHRGAVEQLRLRNVVARFGQCALGARRQIATVVAGLACSGCHRGVVHGDRSRKTDLGFVARVAFGGAGRNRDMVRRFGDCSRTAVVAGVASPCAHCIGGTVGVLH